MTVGRDDAGLVLVDLERAGSIDITGPNAEGILRAIAVEMATEFRAREDYPAFTRGPLKAGDTLRITSFVHYDLGPDGRFARIRVGRYGASDSSPS